MRNRKHFRHNYPVNVNKTISYKPNLLFFFFNKVFSSFISQGCTPAHTSVILRARRLLPALLKLKQPLDAQHENISIKLFIQKRNIRLLARVFSRFPFTFSNFRACKSKPANERQSVCLLPCLNYKNQYIVESRPFWHSSSVFCLRDRADFWLLEKE